jgi:hypothetical protein
MRGRARAEVHENSWPSPMRYYGTVKMLLDIEGLMFYIYNQVQSISLQTCADLADNGGV